MKKIFLCLLAFGVVLACQNVEAEDSLFPELAIEIQDEVEETDPNAIDEVEMEINEDIQDDQQIVDEIEADATNLEKEATNNEAVTTTEPLPPETQEPESEEDQKDDERKIYLALTDISSTVTAVREVSFCSATLGLVNDTKKVVQEISGTIGIGDQTKDFKFTSVQPGKTVGWQIQMVGEACAQMLNVPNVQIKVCKVDGMSNKTCRSKLLYVPLPPSTVNQ